METSSAIDCAVRPWPVIAAGNRTPPFGSPGKRPMLPAFVINLDRAPERRTWMVSSLGRIGIAPTFVKAVDGRRFGPRLRTWLNRQEGEYRLSPVEAALILSHRKVWRRVLASGAEHAIIMEDDVHLADDAADILSTDWSRWHFHVVKLETLRSRVWLSTHDERLGNRSLGRLHSGHLGAAGYVISRAGAQYLLNVSRTSVQPLDLTMFSDAALADPQYLVMQVSPAVAVQEDFLPETMRTRPMLGSGIGHDRGGPTRQRREPKLWREIKRPFRQAAAVLDRARYALRHRDRRWTRIEFS